MNTNSRKKVTTSILAYIWKLSLCGIAFSIGMLLGGMAMPLLGFQLPAAPAGADSNTIMLYFLLGSLLLAFVLSFVSCRLQLRWPGRWLILFALTWIFGSVGMVIEAYFFMTTDAVSSLQNSLFTMLTFMLPSLFLAALVAAVFRPLPPFEPRLREFFDARKPAEWVWRLGMALLVFPVIYIAFGLTVRPLIQSYYLNGQYELVNPTWGQLIPLQLGRSLLFLLTSLPVLIWWKGTRLGLWMTLGFSIYILMIFTGVLTAYWLPCQMRLFHGLEMLADALAYASALVLLLRPSKYS